MSASVAICYPDCVKHAIPYKDVLTFLYMSNLCNGGISSELASVTGPPSARD